MITRIKSPSKDRAQMLESEETRIHNLIDRCFQLSATDKNYIRKKYKQGDSTVLRIFEKHGKSISSINLQLELKKYLNSCRSASTQTLRQRLTAKDKNTKFRLPDQVQRSYSAKKNTFLSSKTKDAAKILKIASPSSRVNAENKSPEPRPSSTLFSSTKNRLKFKNEIKQLLDPINSKPLNNIINVAVIMPIPNGDNDCLGKELSSPGSCQPIQIVTHLSPRLTIGQDQIDECFQASSIVAKQNKSIDASLKLFDTHPDQTGQPAKNLQCAAENQIMTLINKLKESFAEDILSLFFKPYGRQILKDEFIAILQDFINMERNTASDKAISEFCQFVFKDSITLNPRMLGEVLGKICPSKQTKTRVLFNTICKSQRNTVSLTQIYNYFSNFSEMLQRILKKLFQEDLQMLVLEPQSYQNLSYWDLYLMQESLCWAQLWSILTSHPK